MKYSPKVYIKNKYLKYVSGLSKKGGYIFNFYTSPKNLKKEIDEAEQAVAKQKSRKKKILSISFFIFNLFIIAIILGYQISQSEDMSLNALFASGLSLPLLGLALFVWVITTFIESFRLNIFVRRSSGRSRPFLSYKVGALGKYYDCITPMSTGGQPFQIYYLTQRGLNAAAAIAVPMGRYVVNQLAVVVIWIIALIAALNTDFGASFEALRIVCILGFVLNFILILLVFFLSVSEKTGKKLVVWTLRILQKMKIIKNYEKQYNRVIKIVGDFQATIRNLNKSKGTFLVLIIGSFVYNILIYAAPFFVYCALIGYLDFSMFFYIVLLAILIEMVSNFVPLPGGSGVSELSFAALFAGLFPTSAMLTWALIIWKFLTYYIYLLQGVGILAYDNFIGNKKYRWLKKKWELEQESFVFRQDKLHEFKQSKKNKSRRVF
jgi:hypothetical protein